MRLLSIIASTAAITSALLLCLCNESNAVGAFVSSPPRCRHQVNQSWKTTTTTIPSQRSRLQLNSSAADPNIVEDISTNLEQDISSMRVSAIKQELESYGISTKTFLEKSELVTALVQARKEGKTPIAKSTPSTSSTDASPPTSSPTTTSTPPSYSVEERKARIQSEMSNLQSRKVSELKSELENDYGISTKSYFEKSEFVRALAEARVDGVVKKDDRRPKTKKRRSSAEEDDDEEVEEVKAKVEVITNDSVGPRTKKSRDDAKSSGGGGGNRSPFGGGMPGGMGGMDMGNIADMLKGMGGMGGGANPFGGGMGGGAGGMADAMKAAQQAMSNPKVRAVIDKAQKNPKVMAAVQECMGNPMAMAKYMSDPEVGPILKELQDAMM